MEGEYQPIETIDSSANSETEYAGFFMRLVAYLIDMVVLSVVLGIVLAMVAVIMGLSLDGISEMDETAGTLVAMTFAFTAATGVIIASWMYFALMESSPRQGTLGKMAMNIKVTNEEGGQISFLQATGRYFARTLLSGILFIGYIMILFTDKQQGLHDILARCLVLRK